MTITPSAPQAPPRPKAASAMTWGEPPERSTDFSFASAKKAMEWLSNDQKRKMAFSDPAIWRASSELTGRTQRVLLPSAPVAVNAIIEPSGEITAGPAV